jgi:hypothetical protein
MAGTEKEFAFHETQTKFAGVRGGFMSRSFSQMLFACVAAVCALALALCAPSVLAQSTTGGKISVTVLDPSGALVAGASLQLVNLDTRVTTNAATTGGGVYTFVDVPLGTYSLTVSKTGFNAEEFSHVVVEAGRVTDVSATLKVGAASQTVEVTAPASPLLETSSNAISSTIPMKQLNDLPLGGRDISQLAFLTPGFVSAGVASTYNGLPVIAQSNTIDGVVSSSTRMKFDGNTTPGLQARLEDIQEMTVDTGQLGTGVGQGLAAMQITDVTKNGTNAYHGGVQETFQNSYLNANSWINDAFGTKKPNFILNDFGGDVGGPIIKDKLFFFGSFNMSKQPGGNFSTENILTPVAQTGVFTFTQNGKKGEPYSGQTLNLYNVASSFGLPNTINTTCANTNGCNSVQAELTKINTAATTPGAQTLGAAVTGDNNFNQLRWLVEQPITNYFPAARIDYNVSQKVRLDFALEETKYHQPSAGAPPFPGSGFSGLEASSKASNYTTSLGLNWVISPSMVNQFRGGYYYNANWYAYDATNGYLTQPIVNWAIPPGNPSWNASGQSFNLPITTFYPVVNFSDNMTWQHASHTVTYGVTYWREQDHYWNPPDGIMEYNLGLAASDPANSDFTGYLNTNYPDISTQDLNDAENLYATLVGRISGIRPSGSGFPYNLKTKQYSTSVGEYPLDELIRTWGLNISDSWRVKPNLTANYGLLWNFVGDDHDLTSAYHSVSPDGIWGPSGIGNIFQPGTLTGDFNPTITAQPHAYNPWNVTPQPEFGLAWNPHPSSDKLDWLMGHGKTVLRAGYMLRRYTEPQQYFWDNATDYAFAYYQFFLLQSAAPVGGVQPVGTFAPGSLSLANVPTSVDCAVFACTPGATYQTSIPEAQVAWSGTNVAGINPNIRQPYTQQWNFGIQRQLGRDNVLEVRYLGEHNVHQWMDQDFNEVNIFQNASGLPSFLSQFEAAQTNMKNNGGASFADTGASGDVALPFFESAFSSEESSPYTAADYSNGYYLFLLSTGQAGALAGIMDNPFGGAPYYCNLVGNTAQFQQCANIFGYTGAGAGYPINYFQTNPFEIGNSTGYMTDSGYSNYNALQVDFRQNQWHGMQFDANYTWSHALGIQADTGWTGVGNGLATGTYYTLRDPRLNYGPLLYDIRQTLHASGTYDLPFGNGKALLNTHSSALNRIVSGWDVGTIITAQTGPPFQLTGGYSTFNSPGFPSGGTDGGVDFTGLTVQQLQQSTGLYPVVNSDGSLASRKSFINPKYLALGPNGGAANSSFMSPNTTPGTFGLLPYLHGPGLWNVDLAVTKDTQIRENLRFQFQAEFLNAFNHPNWSVFDGGIQDFTFGDTYVSNGSRSIQLRASLQF